MSFSAESQLRTQVAILESQLDVKDTQNASLKEEIKRLEQLIEKLTKEGDKVFDPFAASGIALSVAKDMNRKYLGCEKSEEVFNNAIKI